MFALLNWSDVFGGLVDMITSMSRRSIGTVHDYYEQIRRLFNMVACYAAWTLCVVVGGVCCTALLFFILPYVYIIIQCVVCIGMVRFAIYVPQHIRNAITILRDSQFDLEEILNEIGRAIKRYETNISWALDSRAFERAHNSFEKEIDQIGKDAYIDLVAALNGEKPKRTLWQRMRRRMW